MMVPLTSARQHGNERTRRPDAVLMAPCIGGRANCAIRPRLPQRGTAPDETA